MKVKREDAQFKPVVITLESQAELDCLLICLNQSNKGFMGNADSVGNYISRDAALAARDVYGPLYHQLAKFY